MTETTLYRDEQRTCFRYLPISPNTRAWGAYVSTAGFTATRPGSPYPPYPHPEDYHFTWTRGRVLSHYCFVYLTRGEGIFESKPSGRETVRAGDLIVLFPGVWHRYRPSGETGWDEYWLEFDGYHLRRLMQRKEFKAQQPVLRVGLQEKLLDLFLHSLDLLRRQPPEYQLLLGALATQIIAQALSALKMQMDNPHPVHEVIREARQLLAYEPGRHEKLEDFAARLNMSYSSFRRLFKAETGFSPRQFVLETQLHRATEMLLRTDSPVSRIAEQCGFESIYYFSRIFRKKLGTSPTSFRRSKLGGRD